MNTTQRILFFLFSGTMGIDFIITLYGITTIPGFIEANPLFSFFSSNVPIFATVIGLSKLVVIVGVFTLILWFNQKEPETTRLHGGNLVCCSATIGMLTMFTTLIILNVVKYG